MKAANRATVTPVTPLGTTAPEELWRTWSLDPLVLALAVVAVAFFVSGWRRL